MQHAELETQPIDDADALVWTTKTACRKLGGIHRATLWRLVRKGALEAVKIGGRTMIVASSARNLIAQQLAKAGAE